MIDLSSFEVPTVVKHAAGAITCLADEVKSLGCRLPMLLTDRGLVAAGVAEAATRSLDANHLDYILADRVVANPPVELVDEVAEIYRAEECDGLIGLGGGSSMDTAKAVGVVVTSGDSIIDYEWADPQPIQRPIPPLICVPTTAGTGSEVTLWAVITDPKRRIKFNVGGTRLIAPRLALLDPRLTLGLPPRLTAATGIDALTHAIECYTSAYAQPWPDAVALWAIEAIGQWLRIAYEQGDNEEARYQMMMAAMLAGMSYGTESAGAVHAMSQTAGGVYGLPHGELTAALLPPVMAYNCTGEPRKYARIAQALGEDTRDLKVSEAADLAVTAATRLVQDLAIPPLDDMGIPPADIPMLAQLAFDDPQTVGNPRHLDVAAYEGIYRACFGD